MRRRFLGVAVSLAAVVPAMVTVAVPAVATAPGCNGQVTFMRQDARGFWQVWVSRADLTGQQQLTDLAANSGWAVWSPDGKKLAVDSDRGDAHPGTDETTVNDVLTMNADGSNVKNLTGSMSFSGDPGWSPDGSLIAFSSNGADVPGKKGVYVVRPDGSHLRQVTRVPADADWDAAPRFSPDGRHLVFTRFRPSEGFGNSALFRVGLDGRHLRQLTSFAVGAGDADWSPDGRQLVFEASSSATSTGGVFVVGSNGGRVRTLKPSFAADPVWAPDQSRILFTQVVVGDGGFSVGLATMRTDGSGQHFVSSNPMGEHQPDWASRSRGRHCG